MWVVAFGFLTIMSLGTVPTPLYVLYEQQIGLSAQLGTVVFVAYAVGVALSLFFLGHLSDTRGRRRLLAAALVVALAAAVVFALWQALPGLLIGRLLSGVAVGMANATSISYVMELHRRARPDAGPRRAALVGTAANLGGLGLGAFIAGVLADVFPRPLEVPYWTYVVLLAVSLLLLAGVPETAPPRPARYRPQRVVVPAGQGGRFAAAALSAFVAFALFGLFASLGPAFVSGVLGLTSHTLGGLTALLTFGSAAVAQALVPDATRRGAALTGFAFVPAGLALVVAGAWSTSPVLWLVGEVLVGAGAGIVFAAGIGVVAAATPPEHRAEALAGVFLAAYIGLAFPVLGLGAAITVWSLPVVLSAFAVLASVLALTGGWAVVRTAHPAPVRS